MKYNYTFGILSAFGIIFVVLGHIDTNVLAFDGWFPYYSFHIQLFLFISGYFFDASSVDHVKAYVIKKIKRLLVPFYIWNFVYLSIQTVLKLIVVNGEINFNMGNSLSLYNLFLAPWIENQPMGFNAPTWFIIALFMVEMYNIFLQWIGSKIKCDNEVFMLIITFLIALVGIYFIQHDATGFFKNCCRSMYCFFFYRLGHWYKVHGEILEKINSTLYFAILVCVQFVLRMVYFELTAGVYACIMFDHIPRIIITPIVGIFFWLRIAKLLTPMLKEVKWFVYIGKNTMPIMTHHLFVLFLMQAVVCFAHCNTSISLLSGFDVASYASLVYYVYANPPLKLIYSVLCIMGPLLVVYGVEKVKKIRLR
ncbi:MAG: acyltransferase family protein [Agathobacter sp.]|nr:acyltransferase family protein [Agathobacter sp.]